MWYADPYRVTAAGQAAVGAQESSVLAYPGREFRGIRDDDFEDARELIQGDFGGAFSIAVTARWDRLNNYSRIIDFGSIAGRDNIIVANKEGSATLTFRIRRGRDNSSVDAKEAIVPGEFHRYLCSTTEEGVMRIYRDGRLLACNP